jgi:hypothetical protein
MWGTAKDRQEAAFILVRVELTSSLFEVCPIQNSKAPHLATGATRSPRAGGSGDFRYTITWQRRKTFECSPKRCPFSAT